MIPFLFGFALACFMWGGVFLWLDHRRRKERVSPTKHNRRKYRDAPLVVEVPPPWEREEGGIDYRFINMTGEER